jgi:proteic killer suppression protein
LQIEFRTRHLRDLFEKGKSKKYPLPQQVVKRYVRVVEMCQDAIDIYDLWKLPSLKFEKLEGSDNRFSARLNQKWRLEVEMNWENQQKTKALIVVDEVSKHYGG